LGRKFGRETADAGGTFGLNGVHDAPQILGSLLGVGLEPYDRFTVAELFVPQHACAIWP
jgi:hypothetical protein